MISAIVSHCLAHWLPAVIAIVVGPSLVTPIGLAMLLTLPHVLMAAMEVAYIASCGILSSFNGHCVEWALVF